MSPTLSHVLALLEHDVVRTVGEPYRTLVRDVAARVLALTLDDPGEKVVEEVQQQLHDTFVDTAWPACPRHATHPLWYRGGAWWCEQDEEMIVPLGELGGLSRSAG